MPFRWPYDRRQRLTSGSTRRIISWPKCLSSTGNFGHSHHLRVSFHSIRLVPAPCPSSPKVPPGGTHFDVGSPTLKIGALDVHRMSTACHVTTECSLHSFKKKRFQFRPRMFEINSDVVVCVDCVGCLARTQVTTLWRHLSLGHCTFHLNGRNPSERMFQQPQSINFSFTFL